MVLEPLVSRHAVRCVPVREQRHAMSEHGCRVARAKARWLPEYVLPVSTQQAERQGRRLQAVPTAAPAREQSVLDERAPHAPGQRLEAADSVRRSAAEVREHVELAQQLPRQRERAAFCLALRRPRHQDKCREPH
jgi:hypothetical protein